MSFLNKICCLFTFRTLLILFPGKILIATGYPAENGTQIEIIDLIDPNWKFDFVDKRAVGNGAVGGLLQNQPVICGTWNGNTFHDCIFIGQPDKSIQIMEERFGSSSVLIDKNKLWIIGEKNSTIFISLDKESSVQVGPELPFNIYQHCAVQVNPKTIYLIGGIQNGKLSKDVWIIDPTNNFEINKGPHLNEHRCLHSCSKMRINGKIFLVVVGYLESVEILDTTALNQGWKIGM